MAGNMLGGAVGPLQIISRAVRGYFGAYIFPHFPSSILAQTYIFISGVVVLVLLFLSIWNSRHRTALICLCSLVCASIFLGMIRLDFHIGHPLGAGARYYFYPWTFLTWGFLIAVQTTGSLSARSLLAAVLFCASANLLIGFQIRHQSLPWHEPLKTLYEKGSAAFPVHTFGNSDYVWTLRLYWEEGQYKSGSSSQASHR